jgi:hypothetical protein
MNLTIVGIRRKKGNRLINFAACREEWNKKLVVIKTIIKDGDCEAD